MKFVAPADGEPKIQHALDLGTGSIPFFPIQTVHCQRPTQNSQLIGAHPEETHHLLPMLRNS
jgi:hypothetical protein